MRFRDNDDIRIEAEEFLERYHPSCEIPIPIEEIVESDLNVSILPIPGIRDRFSIDGSISSDLSEIIVDADLITKFTARYRFTLAHEVGHLVLHADYIRNLGIDDVSSWKTVIADQDTADYSKIEYQAYEFAGCVLVPRNKLIDELEVARTRAAERGLELDAMGAFGYEHAAQLIAKSFGVSRAVIERRLKRIGKWPE